MNSELYNSTVVFPDQMKNHLRICFQKANPQDTSIEGYQRNQDLQKQNEITYQQLKRIKNFFDNFQGQLNDLSFILNGGNEMKSWVDTTLNQMRTNPKMTKKNKMNTGMQNQFIDDHQKQSLDVRKSQEHGGDNFRDDIRVTEALKRINELISKI